MAEKVTSRSIVAPAPRYSPTTPRSRSRVSAIRVAETRAGLTAPATGFPAERESTPLLSLGFPAERGSTPLLANVYHLTTLSNTCLSSDDTVLYLSLIRWHCPLPVSHPMTLSPTRLSSDETVPYLSLIR